MPHSASTPAAPASEPRLWAAMIFPLGVSEIFGALRSSPRLHRTQRDARAEVEIWLAQMQLGPITWASVNDHLLIGRDGAHVIIIGSMLPPEP